MVLYRRAAGYKGTCTCKLQQKLEKRKKETNSLYLTECSLTEKVKAHKQLFRVSL